MKKAYYIETGVLLDKTHDQYDENYGMYGVNASLYSCGNIGCTESELGKWIDWVNTFIKEEPSYTYGIITEQYVDDSFTDEEIEEMDIYISINCTNPTIVYQIVKVDNDKYLDKIEGEQL